jgi:transposase
LEEAKAGAREVFFVDAAHFVFGSFIGRLWCFTRLWIKSPSGRQRFNVLGAINAVSHQLVSVTNTTYINAESVCELLLKIAELKIAAPVTLVLDNARYQRCALVQAMADSLAIELLYLPTYSPNLNLIERLWKFVKKQCLYSKYYGDFEAFRASISECLAQTQTTHKAALDSLLTLKFQSFTALKL